MMTRVLVADDHAVVRRGVKQILAEAFESVVIGEAETGDEVMESVLAQDWDILILDITMPGKPALDLLKELRETRPGLPVLILSMHPEEQYALRVLEGGAAGFVAKRRAPEELIAAVEKVLAGEKYVSPSFAEKLVFDLASGSGKPPHDSLSAREYQVMLMLASGKNPTEIAEGLSLSVKTISTFRARVLEKMKMKTNADLTRYALENQLI
jgi:two-component system, NarL family, invasion response regulator UvrY